MENCQELKQKYDACFNTWLYNKFLRGNNDDSECAFLLKVYKECVLKFMKEHQIDLSQCEPSQFPPDNDKDEKH